MDDRTRARLPALALAALCAALGIYLALSQGGEAQLRQAGVELDGGHNARALTDLGGADGQAAGRAHALRGRAYLAAGRPAHASRELRLAVQRDPNNWEPQRDYAVALLQLGQRADARARILRALALNPRMALPVGFVEKK